MSTIESAQRRSFTERALDSTRTVLVGANVTYDLSGETIDLASLFDDIVIPDIDDEGVVTLPDESSESDALAVIALARGEAVTIGRGLDTQSPAQRLNTLRTFKKWGMSDDSATGLLNRFSNNLLETRGSLKAGLGPHAEAATFAGSVGFNLQRAAEIYDIPDAPTATIGKIVARNVVIVEFNASHVPSPQVVTHELAHFVDRTDAPVKTMASQRAIDMRTLRDELRAYNAGAKVSSHLIQTSPLSPAELKREFANDTQLYVDYVRKTFNKNDSDQFRATPEIIAQLEKDGVTLDDIMHGRINFAEVAEAVKFTG